MKKMIVLIVVFMICSGCASSQKIDKEIVAREKVLSPGMTLCATYGDEKICISAGDNYKRTISWDGVSRTITLVPRKKRWHGKLGLVSPGPGNMVEYHNGITRILIEESQTNSPDVKALLKSLNFPGRENYNIVYQDDGLLVIWKKSLGGGGTLDLMIFQILVNGKNLSI